MTLGLMGASPIAETGISTGVLAQRILGLNAAHGYG